MPDPGAGAAPKGLSRPAVRDALALCRLLYVAERAKDKAEQDPDRLAALADAGRMLGRGYQQAIKHERGSLGAKAADVWASRGIAALLALDWAPELGALLLAAQKRMEE